MKPSLDWKSAILDVFAINEGANQVLLEHIDSRAWRAALPGSSRQKTIASIFAHIHNCRLMWLKITGKRSGLPASLNRHRCTRREVALALARSARAISERVAAALEREDGRIRGFRPNAIAFLCYLMSHDAHHRGQIFMVSRQLGFQLPHPVTYGVWNWSKLKPSVARRRAAVG